jgi:hypothetical protein
MKGIHKKPVFFSAAVVIAIFAAGCAVGPDWGSSPYYGGSYPGYAYSGYPGYAYSSPFYGGSHGYYPYSGYQGYPYVEHHDRLHLYRYNQRRLAQEYWKNQQTFNRQSERNRRIFNQQYQKNLRTYMQKNPGAPVPH